MGEYRFVPVVQCKINHSPDVPSRFTGRSFGLDDNGHLLMECEQVDGSKCIHPLIISSPGYILTGCVE
jgi:hypothetical protein